MPISDDYNVAMWRQVLTLSRVAPGESVVVLGTEASNPRNADAAMRASLALDAKPFRIEVPPLAPRGPTFGSHLDVQTTPLTGNQAVVEALKSADIVIDLIGIIHSPEQQAVLAAKTRMLMVIEPPEVLAHLIPDMDDKRRVLAADRMLRASKAMHVTSPAGTDLTLALGRYPTLPEYGFADEPGRWDHWPSGFLAVWPNDDSAQGRVVIDAGDMIFPFKSYVQSRITLDIRDGYIRSIEGGFDAKYLRKHLESYNDPGAFAVSHVGWGLQRKAKWGGLGLRDKTQSHGMDGRAYYGNFLFSTGPNSEAGGSNHSPCHLDIPMDGCSVSLDGKPVTRDGDIVVADQR